MSRQDMYSVSVRIDWPGLGDLGVFDTFKGGEADSDEQKYRPGGMAPPVSLGGAVTMGNITIERLYVLERDHVIAHSLYAATGVATVTVSKQPLDFNKVPYGRPLVYVGKLKKVNPPQHDSTSSDPGLLELEFVPTGTVG